MCHTKKGILTITMKKNQENLVFLQSYVVGTQIVPIIWNDPYIASQHKVLYARHVQNS